MIYGFESFGYEGSLINIEVDLRRGIPAVDIVGLADGAVKESRERVRAAINNSGLDFPPERVLISLSPADIRKSSAGYDLAIALALLEAQYSVHLTESVLVMGELDLSGQVHPVAGAYAALQSVRAKGIQYAIMASPVEAVPDGIKVLTVSSLSEAFDALKELSNNKADFDVSFIDHPDGKGLEFDEITEEKYPGAAGLKYAMAVAAAGRHNLLAVGAPGCGKSMLLQQLPQLTPKLTRDEAPSTTRVWSLAGILRGEDVMRERPFRMPHQTASIEGICGGGPSCRPGEISLAHNGTLFLDEAAEFRTSVLQMLRVPLESGSITLSRAGRSTVFPAKFQLVMATNPCPCGNYLSKDKVCLCSAKSIEQYWKKFSAPLLDRVDIRYFMDRPVNVEPKTLADLRSLVKKAQEAQYARQGVLNEYLTPGDIDTYCIHKMNADAQKMVDQYAEKNNFSARAVLSIYKLSRTVADMCGSDEIDTSHVSMAFELRKADITADLY